MGKKRGFLYDPYQKQKGFTKAVMDFTQPVGIAENIYWVGKYLENDPFQCHPYFIDNGDASVLVDPGSMLEFDAVVEKVETLGSMKAVKYIILHHQDPDLAAAVPEMEKLIGRDDLRIVTHSRMVPLVKHYMITSAYYEIDKRGHRLEDGELRLQFVTTPYCHSPGAFVSYEPRTKTLFSGDIFGGIESSWEFYAGEDYFEKARQFHAEYMPSRDIFNYALSKIEKLDLELIAPQHGSVIQKQHIAPLIGQMKALECGIYIEEGYHEQLIDTIDALKNKDTALRESLNHFRILMEATHEAVIVSGTDGRIVDLNPAAEYIFGLDKARLLSRPVEELVSPESLPRFKEALQPQGAAPFEAALIRDGGETFPALVGRRSSYRDNAPVRITTVIDLSELKEKEEMLFQKAKMAEMGEMIGNIAHQWRQPLAIVNTIISVLREKNAQNGISRIDLDTKLDKMETNIQYMSRTIEDFMDFYRPSKAKAGFSVNEALVRALEILRPALEETKIEVRFRPAAPLAAHGYFNEYTQALVSILNNAIDALLERGTKPARIDIALEETPGTIRVEIGDNAGGIETQNLRRIFEPYFTTKHKSRGTGLGLYLSKMIIEKSMHGKLGVRNTDAGAVFCIELPKAEHDQ